MSKINLEVAESLDFEEGDCCRSPSRGLGDVYKRQIKKDGSIGKVIVPKMNREMLDSDGYKALLDVVEVLQPGAKDEFIKYNEMKGGSVH